MPQTKGSFLAVVSRYEPSGTNSSLHTMSLSHLSHLVTLFLTLSAGHFGHSSGCNRKKQTAKSSGFRGTWLRLRVFWTASRTPAWHLPLLTTQPVRLCGCFAWLCLQLIFQSNRGLCPILVFYPIIEHRQISCTQNFSGKIKHPQLPWTDFFSRRLESR